MSDNYDWSDTIYRLESQVSNLQQDIWKLERELDDERNRRRYACDELRREIEALRYDVR